MATPSLPPTPTTTTSLPPLLTLPLELNWHIFSYFSVDDHADLSLMILRRTHRSFRDIIPHAPYGSKAGYRRRCQLVRAEHQHPYLIPPMACPCYSCEQIVDGSGFGRGDVLPFWYSCEGALGVVVPLGSQRARVRKCNACWDGNFNVIGV